LSEPVLHRDYETRSAADLKKVGAHAYAQHPTTDILVARWTLIDEHGETWKYRWRPAHFNGGVAIPFPKPVADHITAGGAVEGHNAAFEAAIDKEISGPRYGWPVPALEQEHCTMARCAIQALPLDLARACKALGLTVEKDEAGHRLMLKMCKPRKPRKGEPTDTILWHEDPADLDRLELYCDRDTDAEIGLGNALRPMTAEQRRVWLLDQRINRRGVQIDLPFINRARVFAEETGLKLDARMAEVTGGAVDKTTQVDRLKEFVKAHGVELKIETKTRRNGEEYEAEIADKEAIEDLLAGELPNDVVRQALKLRLEGAKSSVKKLDKFKGQACSDGRARGTLQFHGAGPGRWAGRGIQLQNLPRAGVADTLSKATAKQLKALGGAWEVAARDMMELDTEGFELVWGPPLDLLSRMLRGAVIAAPGNKLYFADYAQIEARGTVWAAKQRDAVELFASGGKIYESMGADIFGLTIEEVIAGHESGKNKIPRFCGKEAILGCGYGIGPASFARNAKKKGKVILPFETAYKAVHGWREKNWRVVEYWRELEDAAKAAIESPGRVQWAGPFAYVVKGRWLLCRMPSGRVIYYRRPTIEPKAEDVEQLDTGESVPRYRWAIHYWGVNGITKQWEKESTWGGKLLENCIQGMCVDLLSNAQLNHEAAGYTPVLSVHDEGISETPADFGSVEEFVRIMTDIPAWARGLPVKAEGGSGLRYAK
jgi:DNA polymerase